jgi:hypothetical protein
MAFTKLDKFEYAVIYILLKNDLGYDVVFYTKFETKYLGFIFTAALFN